MQCVQVIDNRGVRGGSKRSVVSTPGIGWHAARRYLYVPTRHNNFRLPVIVGGEPKWHAVNKIIGSKCLSLPDKPYRGRYGQPHSVTGMTLDGVGVASGGITKFRHILAMILATVPSWFDLSEGPTRHAVMTMAG